MFRWSVLCLYILTFGAVFCFAKNQDNKTYSSVEHNKFGNKLHAGPPTPLLFIEELKYLLERQLFGVCPQSYTLKMPQSNKARNMTTNSCDSDFDPELSGRLASLSLRAHSAARSSECWRLGSALANMLGELARAAAQNQYYAANAASSAEAKKRKLSKSQKAKIQAKQKTALAVKKKAAAVAAAAAARLAS